MLPTSFEESFGPTLKRMRDRRGKTQEEVATAVGVSRATVSQWETGQHLPSSERSELLDQFLDAEGILCRPEERDRSGTSAPDVLGGIEGRGSLLSVFRDVQAALDGFLQRDKQGRPLGWCHNLQKRRKPTPMATAFGIKAALLIEDAYKADLGPLGQRLLATANRDGGWGAGPQIRSRPEATAAVIDALVRVDPTVDVSQPLDLLSATVDAIATERPFIMATVLETVLDLRPGSAFATRLMRDLLESRRVHGASGSMLWCQKAEKDLADPLPSVLHTARAVAALSRALSTGAVDSGLVDQVDEAVGTALVWLTDAPDLENTSEEVERTVDERDERLYMRHFTSSWVVRALLLAKRPAADPTVTRALRRVWSYYNEDHSLWRWSNGDLPVWMTFDAIAALRLAALASFYPR